MGELVSKEVDDSKRDVLKVGLLAGAVALLHPARVTAQSNQPQNGSQEGYIYRDRDEIDLGFTTAQLNGFRVLVDASNLRSFFAEHPELAYTLKMDDPHVLNRQSALVSSQRTER